MSNTKQVYIILFIHASFWLIVSSQFGVHADMADHWMTSKFFSLSYLEHPPMVAWTMSWINLLPFAPATLLKIGSIVFNLLILISAYRLAGFIASIQQNSRSQLTYILLLIATPFWSVGALFWNVDQPFILFWILALHSTLKYIHSRESKFMLLTGVWLGFCALSKYIAILFYISLFIWGVINFRRHKLLRDYHFWLAGLISLLIFSPVIWWNYHNSFSSFLFQFQRGLTGDGSGLFNFLALSIGHLFLFSIICSCYSWYQWIFKLEKTTSLPISFLKVTALVPLIFFSLASFRGTITDPKWLSISYLSLFLIIASQQYKNSARIYTFVGLSIFFNLQLTAIIYLLGTKDISNLPAGLRNNIDSLFGWDKTATTISEHLQAENITPPPYVITREYQLGGLMSLYLEHHPFSHSLEKQQRNIWSPKEKIINQGAIIVCPAKDCSKLTTYSQEAFNTNPIAVSQIYVKINEHSSRMLELYYIPPSKN